MGKEAVRDGLKLVKLKNVKDKAAMKIAFEGGVLEMHCAYALRTDGMYSDNAIRELLEKNSETAQAGATSVHRGLTPATCAILR